MSAIGPKRTSASALHMSAFEGKADISSMGAGVAENNRCVSKTRFRPHLGTSPWEKSVLLLSPSAPLQGQSSYRCTWPRL